MDPKVIDVSHHNTIKDWSAIKNAGIVGVIIKATEGNGWHDPMVNPHYEGAKEAGLLVGFYHFLRSGNQVAAADTFCRIVMDNTDDYGPYLFAADHEDPKVSIDHLAEFLERVEENTGKPPIIYSGHVLKEQGGGSATVHGDKYKLWLAQYGSKAVLPDQWDSYWLWQYTDKGTLPGVEGHVDLNACSVDDALLRGTWGSGGWPA
jgi:lysozyme